MACLFFLLSFLLSITVVAMTASVVVNAWRDLLLRFGDEAMYKAKKRGRNAVDVFAAASQEESASDVQIVRLVWKPDYVSGHAAIDREHAELFRLANELIDLAVHKDMERPRFNQVLEQLLAHVQVHFAHEEALLKTVGYGELDEHRQQHQALLAQVQALRQQSQSNQVSLGELMDFLAYELVARHIAGEDVKFVPLLLPA